jgi:hypothetical protein
MSFHEHRQNEGQCYHLGRVRITAKQNSFQEKMTARITGRVSGAAISNAHHHVAR